MTILDWTHSTHAHNVIYMVMHIMHIRLMHIRLMPKSSTCLQATKKDKKKRKITHKLLAIDLYGDEVLLSLLEQLKRIPSRR
jgi:hypothetical protein